MTDSMNGIPHRHCRSSLWNSIVMRVLRPLAMGLRVPALAVALLVSAASLLLASHAEAQSSVRLRVLAPKRLLVGTSAELILLFRNESAEPVNLVLRRQWEGEHGYPLIGAFAIDSQGERHQARVPQRVDVVIYEDGTTSASPSINAGDVQVLRPGEERSMESGSYLGPLRKPGRYVVRATYDSRIPAADGPAKVVAQELSSALKDRIQSDPWTVDVEPLSPAMAARMIMDSYGWGRAHSLDALRDAYRMGQWQVRDVRCHFHSDGPLEGFLAGASAVVQFRRGYVPPTDCGSSEWFETGRYLFVPSPGAFCRAGGSFVDAFPGVNDWGHGVKPPEPRRFQVSNPSSVDSCGPLPGSHRDDDAWLALGFKTQSREKGNVR